MSITFHHSEIDGDFTRERIVVHLLAETSSRIIIQRQINMFTFHAFYLLF